MMKIEDTEKDPRYHATVSPYMDGWMLHIYDWGRISDSQCYSFRWTARWAARRLLNRLDKGTEIIR